MPEKNLYIIAGCNGAGKTTASFTILLALTKDNNLSVKAQLLPAQKLPTSGYWNLNDRRIVSKEEIVRIKT